MTMESLRAKLDELMRLNHSLSEENNELKKKNAELENQIKQMQKAEPRKSQSRYWSKEEHDRFLEGLQKFGKKDVKAISSYVGTRTPTQVRTHAQKYFIKQQKHEKKEDTNTSPSDSPPTTPDSGDDQKEKQKVQPPSPVTPRIEQSPTPRGTPMPPCTPNSVIPASNSSFRSVIPRSTSSCMKTEPVNEHKGTDEQQETPQRPRGTPQLFSFPSRGDFEKDKEPLPLPLPLPLSSEKPSSLSSKMFPTTILSSYPFNGWEPGWEPKAEPTPVAGGFTSVSPHSPLLPLPPPPHPPQIHQPYSNFTPYVPYPINQTPPSPASRPPLQIHSFSFPVPYSNEPQNSTSPKKRRKSEEGHPLLENHPMTDVPSIHHLDSPPQQQESNPSSLHPPLTTDSDDEELKELEKRRKNLNIPSDTASNRPPTISPFVGSFVPSPSSFFSSISPFGGGTPTFPFPGTTSPVPWLKTTEGQENDT